MTNGKYVIVPCTKESGIIKEFALNIFYDCSNEEISVTKVGDDSLKFDRITDETELSSNIDY